MKKTLVLILVLSFFFITVLRGEEKTATSGGRYQLFQGTYDFVGGENSVSLNQKTIFRIDTETGKTYKLVDSLSEDPSGGKKIASEFWKEIDEEDSARALLEATRTARATKKLQNPTPEGKQTP